MKFAYAVRRGMKLSGSIFASFVKSSVKMRLYSWNSHGEKGAIEMAASDWRSVDKWLPEKRDVLCYSDDKVMEVARYSTIGHGGGVNFIDSTTGRPTSGRVTHWMPLPEPPK